MDMTISESSKYKPAGSRPQVKTVSISILSLLAPCGCACRYCLLNSCKSAEQVDYYRAKHIAERFVDWAKVKDISLLPFFYIGYCAEYPQLPDNIEFNKSVGWIGARFLQCNGIAIRSPKEAERFLSQIKAAGIEQIDTTFFGNREYHDAFAGRTGDYDFMLLLAERAAALGLIVEPSIPILKSNIHMLPALLDRLSAIPGLGEVHCFIPDYRGRGALMEQDRITAEDFERLPESVKKLTNISRHRTEADWLTEKALPEYTQRHLEINLRADNIDMFENMTCDEIVSYVEKLDDEYYSALPPTDVLANLYGNKSNQKLYRLRDLKWMWQNRYRHDNGINLYDVTDEHNCNTFRS